jgi:phosphoglycerate dehydrogenase-like enzyme
VHIPGIKENLGLLNYSKLQNIGWVVNLSRAGIVEEKDILKLLDEWKMEFYATDVVVWELTLKK